MPDYDYVIYLLNEYHCGFKKCRVEFDEPWLIKRNDIPYINGEIAFHWQDTHGIDHEILEILVSEFVLGMFAPKVDKR